MFLFCVCDISALMYTAIDFYPMDVTVVIMSSGWKEALQVLVSLGNSQKYNMHSSHV